MTPLPKDILFDFFDGKATPLQRKLIEDWLLIPANEELYYQYLDEWETRHMQFFPPLDEALTQYRQELNGERPRRVRALYEPPESGFRFQRWFWWSIAASIILLATGGGLIYQDQWRYSTYRTGFSETATHRLPDGSTVTLNANSVLQVPRFGFGEGRRLVRLTGEAVFKVAHLPDHRRFVVDMGRGVQIEVLGTEFVAYARRRGQHVFLHKGSIKLDLPQGKQLYMKPGNLFTVDADGHGKLTETAPAQSYLAWQNHWFYFDNTSLSEVAQQIGDVFGIQVIIPDSALARRRIAGNFRATKADQLLQSLSELLNVKITRTNDHIELRTLTL